MDTRLGYAFKRTLRTLEAVLNSDEDYIIVPAFVIVLLSFGAMQLVFEHGVKSISVTAVSAFATATIFFLSIVGFVTFVSTIFIFSYNFVIGSKAALKVSSRRGRVWRLVFSFALAGFATAALFNLFCDGVKEVSLIRAQYTLFLSDGE